MSDETDKRDDMEKDLDEMIEGLDMDPPAEMDDLSAEVDIAGLMQERDELRDKLLRSYAELENTRKRAERDRRDAQDYGGTKLARDLLAVYDNLDRALAAMPEDLRETAGPLVEGIELTKKELLAAFSKHKIRKISPADGDKFDPKLHQAMFEAPLPGAEPGTVIQVMGEGFMIADRLLRPAQVGVASGAKVS